jgi:hypothetical protein
MEYDLAITSVIYTDAQGYQHTSALTAVKAEADLGRLSKFGFPDSFSGKLIGMTPEQFLYFKLDSGIQVGFRGKRYKFDGLEKDGTFVLSKDW